MSKFIIFSLPRSRSAWLSKFLSVGLAICEHDLSAFCSSIAEWEEKFEQVSGVVETGAVVGWRVLHQRFPYAKMAVVRRPIRQVVMSFAKIGVEVNEGELFKRALMLDVVASMPGVKLIEYHQLEDENVCAQLFEYCLDQPHNHNWWAAMDKQNVQIDMAERIEHLNRQHTSLMAFRQEVEGISMQLALQGLN